MGEINQLASKAGRSGESYFSPDYQIARQRFRQTAAARDAVVWQIPVAGQAPDGTPLSIDLARFGPLDSERLLVHISGVHGIEGFAGSAIQLALLDFLSGIPGNVGLLLVHAVNPWGMAWQRRVNANNVDLNRNCRDEPTPWQGAPRGYRRVDPLLNPTSPPQRDGFYLRALGALLWHRPKLLKQAVVAGQYDYPQGLFYGGTELQPELQALRDVLTHQLALTRQGTVIDVHTGLGDWARHSLFARRTVTAAAQLSFHLDDEVVTERAAAAYKIHGGFERLFGAMAKRTRLDHIMQEFGTYSALRMLHGMREENRQHFFGERDQHHPATTQMHELYAPASVAWRRAVVSMGVALAARAALMLRQVR
jgi:hypothetical protein